MSSFLLTIGLLALLAGAGAFGLTEVVRKIPGIERRAIEGYRPWACDLCMSLWTSALMLFALCAAWRQATGQSASVLQALITWPMALGVSLLLLYWSSTVTPALPKGLI